MYERPAPRRTTDATEYWPSQPLVFSWSSVPYAAKYQITVATDESLADQVIGPRTAPVSTTGIVYTPTAPLDPGKYFWAVTPIDAEGHPSKQRPKSNRSRSRGQAAQPRP